MIKKTPNLLATIIIFSLEKSDGRRKRDIFLRRESTVGFRRFPIFLLLILLTGVVIYYALSVSFDGQRMARIQPLLNAGLSLEEAIKFDERFSSQGLRWLWQKNEPYQENEVKFAKMWINNSVIAEFLLSYYYLHLQIIVLYFDGKISVECHSIS